MSPEKETTDNTSNNSRLEQQQQPEDFKEEDKTDCKEQEKEDNVTGQDFDDVFGSDPAWMDVPEEYLNVRLGSIHKILHSHTVSFKH